MSTYILNGQADLQNAQPFLISERALSTKPLEILSFLSPREYLCKQATPEQEYLISSGLKARVSHIMLFPCLSFGLVLTCKTRRKRAISQHLESSFQFGTDCLEPLT
ncbi:hypothetical protein EV2_015158 [Malus domestica]